MVSALYSFPLVVKFTLQENPLPKLSFNVELVLSQVLPFVVTSSGSPKVTVAL